MTTVVYKRYTGELKTVNNNDSVLGLNGDTNNTIRADIPNHISGSFAQLIYKIENTNGNIHNKSVAAFVINGNQKNEFSVGTKASLKEYAISLNGVGVVVIKLFSYSNSGTGWSILKIMQFNLNVVNGTNSGLSFGSPLDSQYPSFDLTTTTIPLSLNTISPGNITFNTSNPSVATIQQGSPNSLILNGVGNATISVTQSGYINDNMNVIYLASTITKFITVSNTSTPYNITTLTFNVPDGKIYHTRFTVPTYIYATSSTSDSGVNNTNAITYAVVRDPSNVITYTDTSGVTINYFSEKGTVTITANQSEDLVNNASSVSETITVYVYDYYDTSLSFNILSDASYYLSNVSANIYATSTTSGPSGVNNSSNILYDTSYNPSNSGIDDYNQNNPDTIDVTFLSPGSVTVTATQAEYTNNTDKYICSEATRTVQFSILSNPCFNKGTKILCLNGKMEEEYVPIENLKLGDLVKTYKHGYKRINYILSGTTKNNIDKKWIGMFKMKKTENNDLIEDLILTDNHAILVDDLENYKEYRQIILNHFGFVPMIDDKYLLLVSFSKNFEKIKDTNIYTHYHFSLENDENESNGYGVWANGILAETFHHYNDKYDDKYDDKYGNVHSRSTKLE